MDRLPKEMVQTAYEQAERLVTEGAYSDARRIIRRFMRLKITDEMRKELRLLLGKSYLDTGDWKRSLEVFGPLTGDLMKEGDFETLASVLNYIGDSYSYKGDTDTAVKFYERSLRICYERGLSGAILARNMSDLAHISELNGRYGEALSMWERAADIYLTTSEKRNRAVALMNIAFLKAITGNVTAATADAEEAFSLLSEVGGKARGADSLSVLGFVLFEQGRTKEALLHMEQAAQEGASIGGLELLRTHIYYAESLVKVGAFDEASLYAEEALIAARELNLLIARCYLLLGRIRLLSGDYVAALRYAEEAERLFRSTSHRIGEAGALICKTEALIRTSSLKQAKETLKRIRPVSEKTDYLSLKSNYAVLQAMLLLAEKKGRKRVIDALRGFRKAFKDEAWFDYLKVSYYLASLLLLSGRLDEAHRIVDESLKKVSSVVESLPAKYQESFKRHPLVRAVAELSIRTQLEALYRIQAKDVFDRLRRIQSVALEDSEKPPLIHLPAKEEKIELVYKSDAMHRVVATASRVAPTPIPVLLIGETGVGKEVLARHIHALSRREGDFVVLNCAAVPKTLIESELFGYTKGAFTGADTDRIGLLLSANDGTLFLDEIGSMPLDMQAKLLRVLEEGTVRPLGSTETIPVDVRFICATNRDLKTDVEKGRFREDLFYRINAVTLKIPPLRERREDILPLLQHFLKKADRKVEIEEDALEALTEYDWPGNVRELKNEVTRLLFLRETRITRSMLKDEIIKPRTPPLAGGTLQEMEKKMIEAALKETGYNKQKAAKLLGISRPTLYEKIRRYRIDCSES